MPAALIYDATEADFDLRVLKASHERVVLVDLWAEWCGPCHVLSPVLEKVIPEYAGRVVLAKVDADENMRIAGRYQVRGFPTVILFRDGVERDRFTSARPAGFVRNFIARHLDSEAARAG